MALCSAGVNGSHGDNVTDTVERVWGTNEADEIRGSPGIDWLWGLGGNDLIIGGAHNDHL